MARCSIELILLEPVAARLEAALLAINPISLSL